MHREHRGAARTDVGRASTVDATSDQWCRETDDRCAFVRWRDSEGLGQPVNVGIQDGGTERHGHHLSACGGARALAFRDQFEDEPLSGLNGRQADGHGLADVRALADLWIDQGRCGGDAPTAVWVVGRLGCRQADLAPAGGDHRAVEIPDRAGEEHEVAVGLTIGQLLERSETIERDAQRRVGLDVHRRVVGSRDQLRFRRSAGSGQGVTGGDDAGVLAFAPGKRCGHASGPVRQVRRTGKLEGDRVSAAGRMGHVSVAAVGGRTLDDACPAGSAGAEDADALGNVDAHAQVAGWHPRIRQLR